jgi:hypothetical protein
MPCIRPPQARTVPDGKKSMTYSLVDFSDHHLIGYAAVIRSPAADFNYF